MFTLVAYRSTGMTGGNWEYVPPLQDQHVRVEGNNIIVPPDVANLCGVAAIGAGLAACRLESPSLRRTVLYDVVPFIAAGTPEDGDLIVDCFYNPIPLDPTEPLRFVGFNGAGSTDPVYGLVWLGDGPQAPAGGSIYTVACDDVALEGTGLWESHNLNFSQVLPAGSYQVVGGYVSGEGLVAWRLIFVGQAWRPGAVGVASPSRRLHPVFRRGGLGVWGEFTHDQPPVLEVIGVEGVPCHIYLDLVKVG